MSLESYKPSEETIDNKVDLKWKELNEALDSFSIEENDLMNEAISGDTKELKTVLDNIDDMEEVSEEEKKTIKEYLKEWNIMWAITEAIGFISRIFGSFFGKTMEGFFSENYSKIISGLDKIDFENMTKEDIESQILWLEIKKDNITDANKKMAVTYVISIFKDELALKSNPDLNKYELLKENLTEWTVLLLNKKSKWPEDMKSKAGRIALEEYNDSLDVSFTHSVIISRIEGVYNSFYYEEIWWIWWMSTRNTSKRIFKILFVCWYISFEYATRK